MNYRKTLRTVSLCLLFLLPAQAGSQTSRPGQAAPKGVASAKEATALQARPVTIYVKNGAPIQGKFIKADNDSLEVEVENARRLTIGLDEVINVAFVAAPAAVSAAPTPDAADEGRSAAMAALKSLRGLDAAVEVGINRKDYANRLIDAKAAVKTMASPTRDVEIQRALDDYELALTFWDFFISLQRISDSIGRS